MQYVVSVDFPQEILDALGEYDFSSVSDSKKKKMVSGMVSQLLTKYQVSGKPSNWQWPYRDKPNKKVWRGTPPEATEALSGFDWLPVGQGTIDKICNDARMYLNLVARVPKRSK